jgi:AraC-like DNA-binding protein
LELAGQEPLLGAVGRRTGMSARTLRRRIDAEGASFRSLVESVRRERADELLGEGRTVKEVCFLLGFSEPSAFVRAFKRWTGRTPGTTRGLG